ncbi:MAG: DUF2089 domain-containing protein [Armatimonadetes bacterium]|nr:DUF2089 domain-containing protein [Armatimonadota bacterium]
MSQKELHPIPARDPVSGGPLFVSELRNDESGVSIRGRFALPAYCNLDTEQSRFLEVFLRCRGILSSVEKELGLSYPTVRSRLDQVLSALNLTPIREEARPEKPDKAHKEILDKLERGEITAQEAKTRIRERSEVR